MLSRRFFLVTILRYLFRNLLLQTLATMNLPMPRALRTRNELPGDHQESSAKADGANHGIFTIS